ncbi:MAG: pyridoxamine 5'-phosphate oxidase family protein [Clostridiaceae bacterium]|nr:pyridoxamine 5'-phosphate oxidase family protein [Clostridiaceae bacterium]
MRRTDRQVTDLNDIKAILESAKVMHMGMTEDGRPYVLPLNYGYELEENCLKLYFHSALSGRKINVLAKNSSVFCEIASEHGIYGEGEEACVYGYHFASVMGAGNAEILKDHEEKLAALERIMERQAGKTGYVYKMDLDKIAVVKITIMDFTAKANMPKMGHNL